MIDVETALSHIDKIEGETWLPIDGWPKYLISDHGRVLSRASRRAKLLKPFYGNGGKYLSVNFYQGNTAKKKHIHQMVVLHFAPKRDLKKYRVYHTDGDVTNNKLSNLGWKPLGLYPERCKLTDEEAMDCIVKYARREQTLKQLADEYCVSTYTIHCIIKGKTYKHLDRDVYGK